MTRDYLNKSIFSLLLFAMYNTSCNGQNTTEFPKNSSDKYPDKQKNPSVAQVKVVKTQGSHPNQNVHCGVQDKAGNLWFGTTGEGIYRYDGKLFTQFTVKNGLNSNTVFSILEDKAGNIWIGTDAGICRYDGKTFAGISFNKTGDRNFNTYPSTNDISSTQTEVWSMLQDKSGRIWFGTTNGVYCYDGKLFNRFLDNKTLVNKYGLSLKSVQCILEDKNGNIWLGSGPTVFEGICRFDGKSITNFKPGGEGWIRSILEDKNGNLWVGTRHQGVWRYDGRTFTNFSEKMGIPKSGAGSVVEDGVGNIWFATLGNVPDLGVWCFDGKYLKNFTIKDGLSNNTVFCILKDKSKNLWFGTGGIGLCRYDGKTFTNFTE